MELLCPGFFSRRTGLMWVSHPKAWHQVWSAGLCDEDQTLPVPLCSPEEQPCPAWKELCPQTELWALGLILCNALECSCQNPWAFLVQSSPDLTEMPGFICAPGPCVVLGSRFPLWEREWFFGNCFFDFSLIWFFSSFQCWVLPHTEPSSTQISTLLLWLKKRVFSPIQRRMMRILGKHWSLIAGKRLIGRGRIYSWVYQQKSAFYDCCHEQVASHPFFLQTIPSWE